MKRILIALVAAIALTGCKEQTPVKSAQQQTLESVALELAIAPSTFNVLSFAQEDSVTLRDEIADRYEHFEFLRDTASLHFLDSIQSAYRAVLDDVTFRVYCLEYEDQNALSIPLRYRLHGRFLEATDSLVAIKLNDGKWELMGMFFSIPGYYDFLGIPAY